MFVFVLSDVEVFTLVLAFVFLLSREVYSPHDYYTLPFVSIILTSSKLNPN